MDQMEVMAKALKAINQRLKQRKDLEAVKIDVKSIQDAAVKMPSLFPPGTDKHPSEAKAAVWQNWADFEGKARALAAETGKLADTDTRDLKALRAQALRIANTCSNCHELYRAKHRH
jgi:cytochrome c556